MYVLVCFYVCMFVSFFPLPQRCRRSKNSSSSSSKNHKDDRKQKDQCVCVCALCVEEKDREGDAF